MRLTRRLPVLAVTAVAAAFACGPRVDRSDDALAARTVAEPAAPPAAASRARPRIVALGDSLTAGLGLDAGEAYPALLQRRLEEAGLDYEVVNAGVSGDTSAGGLRRLDWAVNGDVRVLIVALGGNDGLRGLPVDELRRNLSAIVERAQAREISVILAGMEAPPNFGEAYTRAFHQVYPEVAQRYRVPLVPFLLAGVAGFETMNQRDGIHPTAAGARTVAENVWAVLRPVAEARAARGDRRDTPDD